MLSSRPVQLPTDGTYFPTKTPSRGLKNRVENAHAGAGVAMTLNAKGKNATFAPKTPFQHNSAQPHRLLKDQKIVLTTTRPLGDKTPLPNRFGNVLFQTPLPGMSKLSKLNSEMGPGDDGEGGTPDSAQRPSSTRKHIKQPRNSLKAFETPANKGNHWDLSDGDIMVVEAQPMIHEAIPEDDMDEVEYGPPNTLDLPYQPPFDFELPDYKEVGKTLHRLVYSFQYDEMPEPPEMDIPVSELEHIAWDMIPLPELESDDPFHIARMEIAQASENAALPRMPVSRPIPRGVNAVGRPVSKSSIQASSSAPSVKAVSRPTSRAAPSTATSTTSRIQRVPSAASVKPAPPSSLNTVKNPTRKVAAGSSTKALPAVSRAPGTMPAVKKIASTTTAKSSIVKSSNTTAVPGIRPPPLARGAAAAARRPHTSMPVNSSAKSRATGAATVAGVHGTKVPAPSTEDGLVIAIDLDMLEESDFQFDV